MKDRSFSHNYRLVLTYDGNVMSLPSEDWKKITNSLIEITDSEEIYNLILQRNKIHLKKAQDVSFAKTELGKKWVGKEMLIWEKKYRELNIIMSLVSLKLVWTI